jgi:hypothetical protein
MSIETLLADVADALRENSELLRGLTSKAKAGTADSGKTSRASDEGDEDKPSKRTRTTKPKVPTSKEIGTATSSWLEVDDEGEYNHRKNIIKKILEKFEAPKMSEIAEEDRAEAMALLQLGIDGKDPFPKKSRRDDDDVA